MVHKNSSIIKTKLIPPIKRLGLIKRRGLEDMLKKLKNRKLTLVLAPAGFGKTTLLGQWFDELTRTGELTSWVAFDSRDKTQDVFFYYIISAIRKIAPKIGARAICYIENTTSPDITKALSWLIDDLIKVDRNIILFLDDFHLIDNARNSQFIELLINLSPQSFHIVIAGRISPLFSIANLRVRNELFELTADKLRFSEAESEEFITSIKGLELSKDELKVLYEKSEGWAAGLQLASHSLREASKRANFFQSFTGTFREVADYLAFDVFEQQSSEVKGFLLRTSIFSRISPGLCDFLLDITQGQQFLQKLESDNLFVVPLDNRREWYRYHHLFQEFLIAKLKETYPEEMVSLYERASTWFSENNCIGEAIDNSLLAGNVDRAVALIESHAMEECKHGRMLLVSTWLNRIPESVIECHPKLLVLCGTTACHMKDLLEAERIRALLEKYISRNEKEPLISLSDLDYFKEELAVLDANIKMSADDIEVGFRPVVQTSHYDSDFRQGILHNVLGYIDSARSNFDLAEKHLKKAKYHHSRCDAQYGAIYSDCFMCMMEIAKGNLHLAYKILEEHVQNRRMDLAKHQYAVEASAVLRGVIYYEMNKLNDAERLIKENLSLVEEVSHISVLLLGHVTLAKIAAAKGEYRLSYKILDYATLLNREGPSSSFQDLLIEYVRLKILSQSGNQNEAVNIPSGLTIFADRGLISVPDQWDRSEFLTLLTQTRILLIGGKIREAAVCLCKLKKLAKNYGQGYRAVECMILESICYSKLGDSEQTKRIMIEALSFSAGNEIIRLFVDEGKQMKAIVQSVVAGDLAPVDIMVRDFAQIILNGFETLDVDLQVNRDIGSSHSGLNQELIEAISKRELEILNLIATGESNHNIAAKLYITEQTVKWHASNIFGKLGVKNRTAAVIAAKEIGLIRL